MDSKELIMYCVTNRRLFGTNSLLPCVLYSRPRVLLEVRLGLATFACRSEQQSTLTYSGQEELVKTLVARQ